MTNVFLAHYDKKRHKILSLLKIYTVQLCVHEILSGTFQSTRITYRKRCGYELTDVSMKV